MKIKILNRNLTTPSDYSTSKSYNIDEAPIFTECYNETLDSGTVIISNQTSKIEMEPYDVVEIIEGETRVKYMCIDTYTETMTSINPKIYRYEISLFSETKQLEGTILPNLKISKVKNTTRSIYYYIKQYMKEYCPQIRISSDRLLEEFDTWWGDSLQWEGDHYELIVDFGTSRTDFIEVPVATSDLLVKANAWITDGGYDDYVYDTNCHIYDNSIDEQGHWRITFGINLGTLSGWSIPDLEYGSEDVEVFQIESYKFNLKWKYEWTGTEEHPNLEDKFSDECPEMQWNTPTLREVLNDLMMVKDCIVILKDGKLDYIDISETKNDISSDAYINYITRSKSSEDYVSELQVPLVNVTNKSDEVNNVVTRVEYCTFSIPDNEAIMTTENVLLKTQYPIYNLKSLVIMFPTRSYYSSSGGVISEDVSQWWSYDLANIQIGNSTPFSLVEEVQLWNTKRILYNTQPPSDLVNWPKYQNWSLYYVRGTNEIGNFTNSTKYKYLFGQQTYILWESLCNQLVRTFSSANNVYLPKVYNVFFKVEYETLQGCLFRASKNKVDNERVVVDNQTNSYVDSYSQGFLEYQKANRLGNEQLQINVRYPASYTGHKISIGDVYEDNVIYQCQYQYFKNHTEANAIATKNYVLREYFTGVKSRIRSWSIVSGSEALDRHDLIKYYCEFSWTLQEERDEMDEFSENDTALYLVSPIYEYEAHPMKYCYVRTKDHNRYYPYQYSNLTQYFVTDFISRIVGNSLVFSFKFNDNTWAGVSYHTYLDFNGSTDPNDKYINFSDIELSNGIPVIKNSALVNGGVPMFYHQYTDNNGEFEQIEVIITDKVEIVDASGQSTPEPGDSYIDENNNLTTDSKNFLMAIYFRPVSFKDKIKGNKIKFVKKYNKDSQEITNLSNQFEFCSDTEDICVGKEWLKKQMAVNINDYDVSQLKGIFYRNTQYNYRNPDVLPSEGYREEAFVVIHPYQSSDKTSMSMYIVYKQHGTNSYQSAVTIGKAIKNNNALYINYGDALNNKVLLVLNNIPDGNCFATQLDGDPNYYPSYLIHMNVLKTRNKNIYSSDNHYLINRKL